MSDTIPAVLLEEPDQEHGQPLQVDAKPDVGETIEYKGTEYVIDNIKHNGRGGRLELIVTAQ